MLSLSCVITSSVSQLVRFVVSSSSHVSSEVVGSYEKVGTVPYPRGCGDSLVFSGSCACAQLRLRLRHYDAVLLYILSVTLRSERMKSLADLA